MIAEILHWFKTRTWLKCPKCGHRICPLSITQGNYFWSLHYLKPICGDCVKDVLDAKFPKQETADPDADGPKEKQGNIAEATGGVKE